MLPIPGTPFVHAMGMNPIPGTPFVHAMGMNPIPGTPFVHAMGMNEVHERSRDGNMHAKHASNTGPMNFHTFANRCELVSGSTETDDSRTLTHAKHASKNGPCVGVGLI